MNKQLSKQCGGWWFETHSGSLWRQCNVIELGQHCSRQWLVARFAPSHYPNQCLHTVAWIVGNKLMSSFQVQSYILSCKPNTYILLSYSWFICLHDKNIKPTTNNYFVVLREVIVLIYCSRGTVAFHQELSDLTKAWSRQIYDQRFKIASNLQVFWKLCCRSSQQNFKEIQHFRHAVLRLGDYMKSYEMTSHGLVTRDIGSIITREDDVACMVNYDLSYRWVQCIHIYSDTIGQRYVRLVDGLIRK